jgi:hypothetical protein
MPVYEVEYRSEYSGIENKDTAYTSHRFIAVVLHKQAHKM